jgi:hypothetical protein
MLSEISHTDDRRFRARLRRDCEIIEAVVERLRTGGALAADSRFTA